MVMRPLATRTFVVLVESQCIVHTPNQSISTLSYPTM
eukprot:SAG22_NODE_123_length_18914_cov_28.993410_6_plen_37_part_00